MFQRFGKYNDLFGMTVDPHVKIDWNTLRGFRNRFHNSYNGPWYGKGPRRANTDFGSA